MLVFQLHPLPLDHTFITTLEPLFRKFMWAQFTVENYQLLLTNTEFLKNFLGFVYINKKMCLVF